MPRICPIIFLHLQKTGGTSLRYVINRTFSSVGLAPRRASAAWVPPVDYADVWFAHMSFGLHEYLTPPLPYFTIVRDPVEREVSRFRRNPAFRRRGKTPYDTVAWQWGMVYQLSGAADALAEAGQLDERHVEQALQNLQGHFLYVGDTARHAEVGLWLRDEQHWPIELPLPHVNAALSDVTVTDQEREDLHRHPQVQLDQLLYKEICERGPYPQEW